MPRIKDGFGLYAILTDPVMGYGFMTELLVKHEVSFVQLRMKDAPRPDVVAVARTMRDITRSTATRFIVNDSPGIAAETGADGVHLGQDDMPVEEARAIVGPDAIVGFSTHNTAQTRDACAKAPDYIGVGPVFATPTKKRPDPVIGIEGMRAMLAIATVPAVAIGGITIEMLPRILAAGARNFCMVRPINQTTKPEEALKRVLDAWQNAGIS